MVNVEYIFRMSIMSILKKIAHVIMESNWQIKVETNIKSASVMDVLWS